MLNKIIIDIHFIIVILPFALALACPTKITKKMHKYNCPIVQLFIIIEIKKNENDTGKNEET